MVTCAGEFPKLGYGSKQICDMQSSVCLYRSLSWRVTANIWPESAGIRRLHNPMGELKVVSGQLMLVDIKVDSII